MGEGSLQLYLEKLHHRLKTTKNSLLSMEQPWLNFPMCWVTLEETQKIRSIVNLHSWTSLPATSALISLSSALFLLSWAVYPHLMLVFLLSPLPAVPLLPFLTVLRYLEATCRAHIWLSASGPLSLVLLSSGMGSAAQKRIPEKLVSRCLFIRAHSLSLQLALSPSSHLCTHFF